MLIAIDHSCFFLLCFFFCIPDVINISTCYYTQSFVHSFVNVESNNAHYIQIYTMEKFHLTFDILLFFVLSPLDCAHLCTGCYCTCLSTLESKLYGLQKDLGISVYCTMDSGKTDRNLSGFATLPAISS